MDNGQNDINSAPLSRNLEGALYKCSITAVVSVQNVLIYCMITMGGVYRGISPSMHGPWKMDNGQNYIRAPLSRNLEGALYKCSIITITITINR